MSEETTDGVTIRVMKNGPLTVKGPMRLEGPDGEAWADIPEGANVGLCRCGLSAVKPFCDGSHKAGGFDSAPTATEQPYPW